MDSLEQRVTLLVFVSSKRFYIHDDANTQVVLNGYGFDSHGEQFPLDIQFSQYNSECCDEILLNSVYKKVEIGKFYSASGPFKVSSREDIQTHGDMMTLWSPNIHEVDQEVEIDEGFYDLIEGERFRLFEGIDDGKRKETRTFKISRGQGGCIQIHVDQIIRSSGDDFTVNGGQSLCMLQLLRENDGEVSVDSLDSIKFHFVKQYERVAFALIRIRLPQVCLEYNMLDGCQKYTVRGGFSFLMDDLVPVMSFFLDCCMGSFDGSFLTSGRSYSLFVGDADDFQTLQDFIERNGSADKLLTVGFVLKREKAGFDLMEMLNMVFESAEGVGYGNILWGMAHCTADKNKCIAFAG